MPSAPTLPAVADVLGPPPKAPHAPDVEGVLGPPPRAPHIGGRGHAFSRVAGLRRPPSPPRVGHSVQSQQSKAQAQAPQKIVIEDKRPAPPVPTRKKTLQEEYAPVEPEVTPQAGRPIQRAARNAGMIRDKINALGHHHDESEEPSAEPRPANVQAHHDETRRQVREAMERLRGNGQGNGGSSGEAQP